MTTIAIKDGILAVDSLRNGDQIYKARKWFLHTRLRCIVVHEGEYQNSLAIATWLKDFTSFEDFYKNRDSLPDLYSEGSFALSFITEDLQLWRLLGSLPFIVRKIDEKTIAYGSGGDYALGAMLQGASAEEAVAIATLLDIHTGNTIEAIDIKDMIRTLGHS